jgi:hypothetical protein
MGIEEGEKVQAKRICNIVNKNNNRKFPKSRESHAHSGTGSSQEPNRLDQNRTTP